MKRLDYADEIGRHAAKLREIHDELVAAGDRDPGDLEQFDSAIAAVFAAGWGAERMYRKRQADAA